MRPGWDSRGRPRVPSQTVRGEGVRGGGRRVCECEGRKRREEGEDGCRVVRVCE